MNRFTSLALPAAVAGVVATAIAGIGIATAGSIAHSSEAATPNVVKVVEKITAQARGTSWTIAECPSGDQVVSGGYVQGGHNSVVVQASAVQRPKPGYRVEIFRDPLHFGFWGHPIDSTLTVVAYCAPIGQPVVFGANPGSSAPSAPVATK